MKQKRLTMQEREEIWSRYQDAELGNGDFVVQRIAREYRVSRPTIYSVLEKRHRNDLAGSHKWLSPSEREEIRQRFQKAKQQDGNFVLAWIAREYEVSRPTIYAVLEDGWSDEGWAATGITSCF